MVFVLFNGVLVKNALADNYENNYWRFVSWTRNGNDYLFTFHVKTSFDVGVTGDFNGRGCIYNNPDVLYYIGGNPSTNSYFIIPYSVAGQNCPAGSVTLTAGNDYTFTMVNQYPSTILTTDSYFLLIHGIDGEVFNSWNPISGISFTEFPSLTITYPQDNDEIAGLFTIQGTFTQPLGQEASFLQVETMPAGTYSSSLHSFWQAIYEATSGVASIEIGDLPAGYYDFRIYFRGGDFDFYQGALISNIHIVNDLPQLIPSWQQQPPSTAPSVYQPLEPTTYYTENSTYATSSAMYNTLTGTFAPVLLSVGQNLTDFATRFSQSNASSTGNQLGASIVIVRSYIQNINQFFYDFPLSQILLLYLIALVVVIILRLVKGLINLFKL
jgi:hypothetical protein